VNRYLRHSPGLQRAFRRDCFASNTGLHAIRLRFSCFFTTVQVITITDGEPTNESDHKVFQVIKNAKVIHMLPSICGTPSPWARLCVSCPTQWSGSEAGRYGALNFCAASSRRVL